MSKNGGKKSICDKFFFINTDFALIFDGERNEI